jgi:hypothetical protein
MATQAQILANRQNAQKSTGPRTAEGKANSAQNATKHGLFARQNVVIPENQAQFDDLRDEMLADLAPVGAMEAILAERIVSLTWRLKRAQRMQDEVIDVKIRAEINSSKPRLSKSLITGRSTRLSKNSKRCYDDLALGLVTKWDFEEDKVLERMSMYERRFEASLFKTMAELKKLQVARKRDQAETAETQAASYRGRDARETQGQDALATACKTQGQDALATVRETRGRDAFATARETECAKQSQSAEGEGELTPFKKREYELLIGTPSRSNEANDPQPKAGIRDPKTENRPRRKAGVCRY